MQYIKLLVFARIFCSFPPHKRLSCKRKYIKNCNEKWQNTWCSQINSKINNQSVKNIVNSKSRNVAGKLWENLKPQCTKSITDYIKLWLNHCWKVLATALSLMSTLGLAFFPLSNTFELLVTISKMILLYFATTCFNVCFQ